MTAETKQRLAGPSRGRRAVFVAVAFILALGLAEVATRVIERVARVATHKTSSYVDFVNPVPVFEAATVDGRSIYQRTPYQPLVVRGQSFLVEKPKRGVRVFMLGGSAASGWPHEGEHNGYTITSLLERKLRQMLPDRPIEVVNVAGSTYGSHRVKFVFDEIIDYQPDLVLIYSGNNEFLENFVFRPRLPPVPWSSSALARQVYDAVGRWSSSHRPEVDVKNYSYADQAVNRISYAFGQSSRYRQDPEQYREVLEHYLWNIRAMVAECQRRNVPVMLLNCPVNLKDWIPNVSVHSRELAPADFDRWQERYRRGVLALEGGDPVTAADALREAAIVDDEHAETHYRLGVALQKLRRVAEAKVEYEKALERDAYPFRNLPEFRRGLERLAGEAKVPCIDSVSVLDDLAGDGIAGLDVLVDYVHLRGQSQEAIAQAVAEEMVRDGLLGEPLAVPVTATRIEVPPKYDQMATDRGLVSMYRQLLVMRQYDKLDELYERMVGVLQASILAGGASGEEAARQLQIVEHIQPVVVPYRKLLRAEQLGILSEEFTETEAREIYYQYTMMIRVAEGQGLTLGEFLKAVPDLSFPSSTPGD